MGALDLTGMREFPTPQLLTMIHALAHRGPDDEQIHIEPGLALAARRLAIIDLLHGSQPISNVTGNLWATFNGELFDYPEQRKTLIARGHQIKTHCDTELWTHFYEEYGETLFEHSKGQFAVAIWDRDNRKLLLGRDRVGICPLYYTEQDGWLLWASEIKALLASGLVKAQPDIKGIDYLFHFLCSPTRRTFFKGIHLLPPGHFIRVTNQRKTLCKYWDLDFPDAGEERSLANPKPLIEELEQKLSRAVQRRLRSDVPVVSYISGGLDSSVILSLASRERSQAIPSFTIGMMHGAGPNEQAHSAQVATLLGSPLTTLTIDAMQIANVFPELITAAEGPVLDTSCAALLLLAAEVHKQGYKVVLTGEGADEALAGYFWFKTQKISSWINPKLSQLLPWLLQRSINRGTTRGKSIFEGAAMQDSRPAQRYIYEMMGNAAHMIYSDQMKSNLTDHNPFTDLDLHNERFQQWHPLNQSIYVGYKVMLPGLLMMSKGDRITMHSSVETRYPFLDEDVIEFCASIAPEYKLRGLKDKWILRQVAGQLLPQHVANRPKAMFRANLSRTFLGSNHPAWIDQLLSKESMNQTGYFDLEAFNRERFLQRGLMRMMPRQHIFDATLTNVITTQLWHHLFCGGGLCDLPTWTDGKK